MQAILGIAIALGGVWLIWFGLGLVLHWSLA
jgi:hypothetical protein